MELKNKGLLSDCEVVQQGYKRVVMAGFSMEKCTMLYTPTEVLML